MTCLQHVWVSGQCAAAHQLLCSFGSTVQQKTVSLLQVQQWAVQAALKVLFAKM
jgi:hypothetical protein